MIDLNYALKQFNLYRGQYPDDEGIELKYKHMFRVMKNSITIATNLGLSDENIKLAGLIGLLHDIGRFEQYKRFSTFVDKDSIDHAMFSSYQLFDKNLIYFFLEDSKYNMIIKSAIENHSHFEIDDGLNEECLLHAKIIRDADKVDIYRQIILSDGNIVYDGSFPLENDVISESVMNSFRNERCIKNSDMKTKLDDLARKCALMFGFYFPEVSLEIIYRNNYIYKLINHYLNTFPTDNPFTLQQIGEIKKITNKYIGKKLIKVNNLNDTKK